MKNISFTFILIFISFSIFSCKADDNYIYKDTGETLSYPETITNSSIDSAISTLNGWTDNMSSMDIAITGTVNQNLLLKLKESINSLQVKVQKKQTVDNNYSFLLNLDFSGITGVTSFNECYFNNCNILGSVKIPESFTSINKYTFTNCTNLKSLNIPSKVTEIGYGALSGSGLENISIKSDSLGIGAYAFEINKAAVSVENTNNNIIRITNCLAEVTNPFCTMLPASFKNFAIDENYESQNSTYKYKYSKDSNGSLFCTLKLLSDETRSEKILINYPNSVSKIEGSEDKSRLDSAYNISSMFTEDYILGKNSIEPYSSDVTDCKVSTGFTTLPNGKGLYYTSTLNVALNRNSDKWSKSSENATLVKLEDSGLSDYSDIYKIILEHGNNNYIFLADIVSE